MPKSKKYYKAVGTIALLDLDIPVKFGDQMTATGGEVPKILLDRSILIIFEVMEISCLRRYQRWL